MSLQTPDRVDHEIDELRFAIAEALRVVVLVFWRQ